MIWTRENLKNILSESLNKNYKLDWDACIDTSTFDKKSPSSPQYQEIEKEPVKKSYINKYNLFDKFLQFLNHKGVYTAKYFQDHSKWLKSKEASEIHNASLKVRYKKDLAEWQQEKNEFINSQTKANRIIQEHRDNYSKGKPEDVIYCITELLKISQSTEYYTEKFDLEFIQENAILIINFPLMTKSSLPNIKSVKYIVSKDETLESYLTDKVLNELHENVLYQICLKTMYDIFKSDEQNIIKTIVFNGWLSELNRGTGHEENNCIMSILVNKSEFMNVNFRKIDPKACFFNFKGLAGHKLSDLVAVAPVMEINKKDKRFINSKEIGETIKGHNIAAMDWSDFEHLIREVFSKEFEKDGVEIRVTQSSRDGGIDAIMFDPDPIRGGKFVIQAKRYTNLVGISAVRDLYGAITNERAVKGILVTTSDFGSDSYEFAKDKPISLVNGNNLLFLLNKHGYNARIDIKEARKILGLDD